MPKTLRLHWIMPSTEEIKSYEVGNDGDKNSYLRCQGFVYIDSLSLPFQGIHHISSENCLLIYHIHRCGGQTKQKCTIVVIYVHVMEYSLTKLNTYHFTSCVCERDREIKKERELSTISIPLAN